MPGSQPVKPAISLRARFTASSHSPVRSCIARMHCSGGSFPGSDGRAKPCARSASSTCCAMVSRQITQMQVCSFVAKATSNSNAVGALSPSRRNAVSSSAEWKPGRLPAKQGVRRVEAAAMETSSFRQGSSASIWVRRRIISSEASWICFSSDTIS